VNNIITASKVLCLRSCSWNGRY